MTDRSIYLLLLLILKVDLISATKTLNENESLFIDLEDKSGNLLVDEIADENPPTEPFPAPRSLSQYHENGYSHGYGGYHSGGHYHGYGGYHSGGHYHTASSGGKGKGKGYHHHYYQPQYRPLPPQTYPVPRRSTCYYLKNSNTGKYLDLSAGSCNNGNNIQVSSFNGGANQIWCDGPNNSIYSQCCPHMVLDIQGGSCTAGCNVQLWDYHGRSNQQFVFDGKRFINYSCNLAIDQSEYSFNNVIMWFSSFQCWEKIYV